MDRDDQLTRRVHIPSSQALDISIQYLQSINFHTITAEDEPDGITIFASGEPPRTIFQPPKNCIKLTITLADDPNGGTQVGFKREVFDHLLDFVEKQYKTFLTAIAALGLALSCLFVLVGAAGMAVLICGGIFLLSFVPFLLEYLRIRDFYVSLESGFWRAFDLVDKRMPLMRSGARYFEKESLAVLFLIALVGLVVILLNNTVPEFLWIRNILKVILVLLVMVELLINYEPFLAYRYTFLRERLFLSMLWFILISLPGLLVIPFTQPDVFQPPVLFFIYFGWLVTFLLFLSRGNSTAKSIREEIGSLTAPPSEGYETLQVSKIAAWLYKITALAFLLTMAGYLYFGIFHLLAAALDPAARGRVMQSIEAVASFSGEQFDFFIPHSRLPEAARLASIIFWATLSVMSIPLAVTLVHWARRLARLLFGERKIGSPAAAAQVEANTRPGLIDEIRQVIGAQALDVLVLNNPLERITGASILMPGILGGRPVLMVDSLYIAMLDDRLAAEAIIWHEVGHLVNDRPLWRLVLALVFNFLDEQARAVLIDPLLGEIRADAYAARRMGDARPLIKALETMKAPRPRPIARQEYRNMLRLMVGDAGLADYHPHSDIRIAQLRGLEL